MPCYATVAVQRCSGCTPFGVARPVDLKPTAVAGDETLGANHLG